MSEPKEQAVILQLKVSPGKLAEFPDFEEDLTEFVESTKLGEYDGHDVDVSGKHLILYFYGLDAKKLFAVLLPHFRQNPIGELMRATIRLGPAEDGVPEQVVEF